jgi:cytoskeleton protein RodZ
MFEIGNSLREARLRQELDFPELEQQTKIRSKYLKALEDEQFEVLPAPTYVKGFLRNYADALGLEGQLYVDEYNSRFVTGEEDVPLRPRDYQRRPQSSFGQRFETRGVVLTLVGIAIVFALAISAWKFGSSNETPQLVKQPTTTETQRHRVTPAKPQAVKLVLTAVDGPSWLEIHANSVGGKLIFRGTLEQGRQLPLTDRRFVWPRLWIAAGQPWNLVARVNGRIRLVPATPGKSGYLIVTAKTIRKAASRA